MKSVTRDWVPDNLAVKNQIEKPLYGFSFLLRVEGAIDVACKSVRNFKRENEFEYIQEGGLNDYVHLKRKPVSKPFTFQVERYAGMDYLGVDPLALGTELFLPLVLLIYDSPTDIVNFHRMYTFTGCTVIGKDYGELNSEKSSLVTETITIAFREMACVDNAFTRT